MSQQQIKDRLLNALHLTPGIEEVTIPSTGLVRVSTRIQWGESLPQSCVYFVPTALEPPHDVAQVSRQQFDFYVSAVCDLTAVVLVTLHNDALKCLPSREVHFDGDFPTLLKPSQFNKSLRAVFYHYLRIP